MGLYLSFLSPTQNPGVCSSSSPCSAARSRRTVGTGRPDGFGVAHSPLDENDLDPRSSTGQVNTAVMAGFAAYRHRTSGRRRFSPKSLRDSMGQGLLHFITRRTTGTEAILAPCRSPAGHRTVRRFHMPLAAESGRTRRNFATIGDGQHAAPLDKGKNISFVSELDQTASS